MKAIFIITILFSVNLFAEKTVELGNVFEFYKINKPGSDVQLKLLRVGEKKNEEVLLKVTGADDTLNNKTYKYKKVWQNSNKTLQEWKYCTKEIPQYKGKEFCPLHSNNAWGSVSLKFFFFDEPNLGLSVSGLSGYNPNLDPQFFYKQYLKQLKDDSKSKN